MPVMRTVECWAPVRRVRTVVEGLQPVQWSSGAAGAGRLEGPGTTSFTIQHLHHHLGRPNPPSSSAWEGKVGQASKCAASREVEPLLYQSLRSNAITLKSYRKRNIEHQLIIRDWSVEQKRESREREKGLACASRLSGHLIVLWGNKLYSQ